MKNCENKAARLQGCALMLYRASPARLRLEAVLGLRPRAIIFQFVNKRAARPLGKVFMRRTGFLVVVMHSVGKGAARPLDKVLLD